jgi:hypothetical protein
LVQPAPIGAEPRNNNLKTKADFKLQHYQAGNWLDADSTGNNNDPVPNPSPASNSRPFPWLILGLGLAFLFRLAFGLCSEIWFIDQQQVYLIGLKFYCTGQWPYFGADVAPHIQLPGALQGLVVGGPLFLCPIPEAPYVLLNLLSFAGLCFFAWYCSKRLPQFPRWMIYTWLLTAPWVMAWSTNIDNDSYVIFGSCLFFIGFLETVPALSLRLVRPALANFLMGFGYYWNMQFHMSYVLLIPFMVVSLYLQGKEFLKFKTLHLLKDVALPFLGGCLLTSSFLIPTFLKYPSESFGGMGRAVMFNTDNFQRVFEVLFRYLALACCEIPRFIGANTAARLEFLKENLWIAPFAVLTGILGAVQLLALVVGWFQKNHPQQDWATVKWLALVTFLLIYVSFLFAIKPPAAHTYYLTLPIVMLYGFYVYSPWVSRKWFRTVAMVLLACNILFQAGLALHNLPVKSLYKNRDLFVKAIQGKNYQLLGERRPDTLY